MILHCETKPKNINSFLCKDQLLSVAATASCSGEILDGLKFLVQTLEQYL